MRRFLVFLKWFAILIAILIVLAVVTIIFVPDTWLRKIAGERGSEQLGRSFSIDGPIHIDWDWTTPYVHLGKVRLANKKDAQDPDMVAVDEIDFHIRMWKLLEGQLNLPDITLIKPHIVLEKAADGTKNWDLPTLSKAKVVSTTVLPSKRSNFPLLNLLSVEDGVLVYRDDIQHLDLKLAIAGAKGSGAEENGNFKLTGQGSLQGQVFDLKAEGGSLAMLRDSSADYPLHLHMTMGKTNVQLDGTFEDPVQMKNIDATLELRGANMADLFYLTAMPLPPTPAYQLSGHLTRQGEIWTFEKFKGQVGKSDLEGHLDYDTSGDRGFAKAQLTSDTLRMEDLSGFIGAKPADAPKTVAEQQRLLPDVPINLDRLRATDMDVTLKVRRLEQPGWPLDNMDVRFNLKDGVLRLDPFGFGVAGGKVSGPVVLDGSKDVPQVSADLLLQKLNLKPFFSDSRFAEFSSGRFGGKFDIKGRGRSLAEVLGDGNGRVTVLMSGGTVSKLVVAAAGLDFGKATPALLGKDESTNIRCVIGDFGVQDGSLNSDIFVIDTGLANIQGKAAINLKDETIDAKIESHPKEATVAAGTPIVVTGKLKDPSVGLDPKEIGARGVAAAVLGVIATPIASIIPFIELGLGEDSDCRDLISAARAHSGTSAPPTNPAPNPKP